MGDNHKKPEHAPEVLLLALTSGVMMGLEMLHELMAEQCPVAVPRNKEEAVAREKEMPETVTLSLSGAAFLSMLSTVDHARRLIRERHGDLLTKVLSGTGLGTKLGEPPPVILVMPAGGPDASEVH